MGIGINFQPIIHHLTKAEKTMGPPIRFRSPWILIYINLIPMNPHYILIHYVLNTQIIVW